MMTATLALMMLFGVIWIYRSHPQQLKSTSVHLSRLTLDHRSI